MPSRPTTGEDPTTRSRDVPLTRTGAFHVAPASSERAAMIGLPTLAKRRTPTSSACSQVM